VQKADPQSVSGKYLNQVTVTETIILIYYQQFWLYAAANPQANDILQVRCFLSRNRFS